MRAVTWQGKEKMEVTTVSDPIIQEPTDMIIQITATAICGSDLHLYHHGSAVLEKDYVVGHEPMGIVVETGKEVKKVKKGDRVVIPFNISCGHCHFCTHDMESQCDNSNPNPDVDYGGLFGFGKVNGNYPGGQAEYLRVPFADTSSFVVPESNLPDEKVLFLSDIVPTAWWSVENSQVKPGDTVIVLGSGPVGLLAQKFAKMKGAERVIAVDCIAHRIEHSAKTEGVETFNFMEADKPGKALKELTNGGADVVIDCVGMDGVESKTSEKLLNTLSPQMGTIAPLKTAIECVKKFGTVQMTGVYLSPAAFFPLNELFSRNVVLKSGQAPVVHLMPKLYDMISNDVFDPTEIITHVLPLEKASEAYQMFDEKADHNIKTILKP